MTEVNQTLRLEDTPKITNKNFDGGIALVFNIINTETKYKYRENAFNSELIKDEETKYIHHFK